jgi:hypothetical protein
MRPLTIVAALLLLPSCSDRNNVTQPTPLPQATVAAPSQVSYSLEGWVHDTAGRPIEGATVEVLNGLHVGATTSSGRDGRYSFSQTVTSIPGMRATKAGYQPADGNVFVLMGSSIIRGLFRLGSPNPPIDLGGNYLFTFTADASCTSLPPQARARTYQATIPRGQATHHVLTLTGARFADAAPGYSANTIYVSVFENFVQFYFSDPPIWELLDAPTSLYVYGDAQGEITGAVSSFPVWGEFEFCGSTGDGKCEEEVECESSHHTLTLTRR